MTAGKWGSLGLGFPQIGPDNYPHLPSCPSASRVPWLNPRLNFSDPDLPPGPSGHPCSSTRASGAGVEHVSQRSGFPPPVVQHTHHPHTQPHPRVSSRALLRVTTVILVMEQKSQRSYKTWGRGTLPWKSQDPHVSVLYHLCPQAALGDFSLSCSGFS